MERLLNLCNQLDYHHEQKESNRIELSNACGIVGYVGDGNAVDYLLEGLRVLENRGYDSAGISTITHENTLETTKFAGNAISRLADVAPSIIFFSLILIIVICIY